MEKLNGKLLQKLENWKSIQNNVELHREWGGLHNAPFGIVEPIKKLILKPNGKLYLGLEFERYMSHERCGDYYCEVIVTDTKIPDKANIILSDWSSFNYNYLEKGFRYLFYLDIIHNIPIRLEGLNEEQKWVYTIDMNNLMRLDGSFLQRNLEKIMLGVSPLRDIREEADNRIRNEVEREIYELNSC